MASNNPDGRPTKYRDEYCKLAYQFCLLGATDARLAENFEVTEQTLNNWKTEHPEFFESIKEGREVADAKVADALYNRAIGYSHPDVDIRTVSVGIGVSKIVTTDIIKHYPPDTGAAMAWLKNRQPKQWRDKQEVALSTPDGAPLVVRFATAEELAPKHGDE